MKFSFIDRAKSEFPVQRLCQVLDVSPSGYFAWRERPASCRQRQDLVILANARAAFAASQGMARKLSGGGLPPMPLTFPRYARNSGPRRSTPSRV